MLGRDYIDTIRRVESFEGSINSQTGTLYKVQVALERGRIEFLDDDRPGVRLRCAPQLGVITRFEALEVGKKKSRRHSLRPSKEPTSITLPSDPGTP
jgi:hypothetical protein